MGAQEHQGLETNFWGFKTNATTDSPWHISTMISTYIAPTSLAVTGAAGTKV
jgi:hypothetical protein